MPRFGCFDVSRLRCDARLRECKNFQNAILERVTPMVRQSILAASMALLLIGPLAGCTTVMVENIPGAAGDKAIFELDQATRNGALLTTISGNPFGGDKTAFDARVLHRMRGQNRGVPAAFVTAGDRRTDPAYRIVVAFNPAAGVTSDDLCRNRGGMERRTDAATLTMKIAFCQGESARSGAAGHVTDVTGVGDSRFADLVETVTRVMVVPNVPDMPRYPYYDGQYTFDDDDDD